MGEPSSPDHIGRHRKNLNLDVVAIRKLVKARYERDKITPPKIKIPKEPELDLSAMNNQNMLKVIDSMLPDGIDKLKTVDSLAHVVRSGTLRSTKEQIALAERYPDILDFMRRNW